LGHHEINCNNMDVFMTVEWDPACGVKSLSMLDFLQEIEPRIKAKVYGESIKKLVGLAICRGYDFKERKRFKKDTGRFEYDILLDFYLIKSLDLEDKKKLIKYQLIKITELTFSKYKFVDFDKAAFLADFKSFVETTPW
jgi:hypothetical protein